MRKLAALAVAAAMLCGSSAAAMPVCAIEAVTAQDYSALAKTIPEFPDPEEKYSEVVDGSFTFHVYKEFAVLAKYMDTTVTEVVIPAEVFAPETKENVPVVGCVDNPFGFCRDLEKITLPDTFEHFTWFSLTNTAVTNLESTEEPMPKVKEVVVSETNPYFTAVDGILYSKDMKTLVGCPPALGIKELKLPAETESIGDYAFYANLTLEKAVIPATVKHIHNNAFVAAFALKSVELPETITAVSGDMFFYCTSLTDVKFNGKVEQIGYGAFNHCDSLTQFDLPETVTVIGRDAFKDTPCTENVGGIDYIGSWAVGSDEDIEQALVRSGTVGIAEMTFMVRNKCTLVDIPASVKYIGNIAYTGLSTGKAAVVHYRAAQLPEKVLAAAKNTTDFYFYDPACDIFDSEKTIPAEYKYSNGTDRDTTWSISADDTAEDNSYTINWTGGARIADDEPVAPLLDDKVTGEVTIHGYAGSTAQKYAEKYNRKFELIAGAPRYTLADGYDYEYRMNSDADSCSFIPDGKGGFAAEWDLKSFAYFGKGLISTPPVSNDYRLSYDVSLDIDKDSYKDDSVVFVGAYAELSDRIGCLYVTDSHTASYSLITDTEQMKKLGSFTASNGDVYDLCFEKQIQRSIGGEQIEIDNFISVRRDSAIETGSSELTGTIDFGEHIDAFAKLGYEISTPKTLSLIVDANKCKGSAKLNSCEIKELKPIAGDLNGDGRLDSFDLILFRKELVDPEKQANHSSLADMDGDGKTQVNDLVLISNFVLGKKAVKV